MEPNARFRRNVRGFYAWLGSLAIVAAAPVAAMSLIDAGTPLSRLAGVAVGTCAFLPWMWVVLTMIRRADEFERRLHLIALGFAFAGTLLLLVTIGCLVQAELLFPPAPSLVVLGALVLWFAALLGVKSWFGRQP